jgi:deoxyribodipyrimidine photo-lyase
MQTAIWWIRRDVRLVDNQALAAALDQASQVIPVFIIDPRLLASPYASEKRIAFLFGGLRALDASLRARGNRLVVRRGDPLEELSRLQAASEAGAIFAEPDYSPYARQRDARVARRLNVTWVGSPAIHPPGSVLHGGAPYTVFTPFSRAWKTLPAPGPGSPAPWHIPTALGLESLELPDPPFPPLFPPGEAEALRHLNDFVEGDGAPIFGYATGRNRLDQDGTSTLSPYLRFGMLSARQAAMAALRAIQSAPDAGSRESAEAWLNELIWRDFYLHILEYFPQVRKENFRLPHVAWRNEPQDFAAWSAGRTGYPLVDAAMRQLERTGWMHNRARMVVASFLTKDLLVDWRWGERWFMQHLVDGDPASNNGGWQWAAGTGADAAPYFRIFNPVSQGLKHDPHGATIRRWLPELEEVPEKYIHSPWRMPGEVQQAAGCRIGLNYPAPIVEHAPARRRALEVYGKPR